jgi:hypothetical protein
MRCSSCLLASRLGSAGSRVSRSSSQQIVQRSSASAHLRREESSKWFAWYSRKLDTHPIATKCISAGLVSCIGNMLAQGINHHQATNDLTTKNVEKEKEEFQIDFSQVGRFAFLNVIFVAPVLHYWYGFINKAVPGSSASRILQRVFWDEFVFSPVYIPVFLGGLWKLEGSSLEQIKTMMYNEFPGIIVAEWVLWVPTMAVTFRYAPVKFQVLVINCVGIIWQTFLSVMVANAHSKTSAEKKSETILGTETPHSHGRGKDDAAAAVGMLPPAAMEPKTATTVTTEYCVY